MTPRFPRLHRGSSALLALAVSLMALFGVSCATVPRSAVDRVRRIELSPKDLPAELDGYRIAFVSDIHYGNNFSRDRLIRLFGAINAEGADCVIIGGDLSLSKKEIPELADEAKKLSAPEGVYAVSGNHDFWYSQKAFIDSLRGVGIVVLDETLVTTPKGVTIAGINDFRDIYPDLPHFLDILDPESFTILASHDPDFAEETDLSPFDLVLSGHTHGGQITFFGYAPVLPSAYGQKYRTGTIIKDETPVIVSNGAGYSGMVLRFRLCAPSDYLVITLRSPAPTKGR